MVIQMPLHVSEICPLFAFLGFSTGSLVIIGVLAVLLFGERLPEVSRKVGKWIVDIKREVSGLQNEIRGAMDAADSSTAVTESEVSEDREEATAPKFEPPSSTLNT